MEARFRRSCTSTVAIAAPVILLESSVSDDLPLFTLDKSLVVSGYWTSAIPQGYSNTVEILASGKVPGILEPGESVTVPVYYAGMQMPWNFNESQFHFDLRIFNPTDTDSVDWGSLQSSLQPAGISNTAWATIYGNLTSQLGNTWGSYVQFLDNQASYLGQLDEDVTDINQLWGFAVQQADNALSPVGPSLTSATDDSVAIPGSLSLSFSRTFASSIEGRDLMGPLGLGSSTPWQTTASVASDGTVTVAGAGGAKRVFQPDSRTAGAYFSQPGDTGTLTADGHGGYLLTEADGTATDYNPNGSLNYLQDTNGNRITAGYTNGELTSLTASSGQSLTIAYNAAGLISTVSDSEGRTTTYNYDSANQYLLSVTGFNGQTTSYTYNTNSVSPAQNALTSIAFPGGTYQYFTYDDEGRLSSTYNNGGAQPQTFTYSTGEVSDTDGTGDTTQLYYNEQGLVVKSIDPLGNVTLNIYDSNFNLSAVTNAFGQSETYTYNAAGEVTSSTDYLGNMTYFTYSGPYNNLSSMTDANGNTTSYTYSSTGDLLSTTYANGTSSSSTYDPEGNATSFLNANGQPIAYTCNTAGQMTTETFSDGSKYTYTYDTLGDLLTATDSTGTTTFTYDPTTELMTEVAYPNGMYLTFTYNAAGQRTSMVDQTGFTTDYIYDSVGRLSELTDGSGNMIVTYTYDANGRLSQKSNGNGTYTTYQYDADGNILHLINYAPDGTVNSRFDYTYNALGLETTEATLDGNWTYTYDVNAQLIHAVFDSANSEVTSQDLTYSYDAMGNRITTVINGITTAYVTNDMNEYTSVGGVPYTYDKDGNLTFDGTNTYTYDSLNQLIRVTGPGGTTTYTYNSLGQRIASTTGDVATEFVIDPSGLGNVVAQYTANGSIEADYTYGLGLTSQVTTGGTFFYDFDTLGSTAGMSNSYGSYVDTYSYLPFGGSLLSTQLVTNPFQFIGVAGSTVESNGMQFMHSRYAISAIGRFTTPDPLGKQSPNLYAYASNNPITNLDPTGLDDALQSAFGDMQLGFLDDGPTINFEYTGGLVDQAYWNNVFGQVFQNSLGNGIIFAGEATVLIGFGTLLSDGVIVPFATEAFIGAGFASEDAAILGEIASAFVNPFPSIPTSPEGAGIEAFKQLFEMLPEDPNALNGPDYDSAAANSMDPNAMIGPAGYGISNFVADLDVTLPYQIDFENATTATAPAQAVTITDQLDPNLDWTTFQLTGIRWGDTILSIPTGSQHYEATVPMTYNGQTFDVEVEAGIHTATGQVYATFQSIDPNTSLPPDVLTGFLPQEDGTGRGMGYISFMVDPKSGLATGTQIRNVALITFDSNGAIATDQVDDEDPTQGIDPSKQALVTIDSGAPTSSVNALPTYSSSAVALSWSGTDDTGGSGIASYDVFVSDDSGPYVAFLTDTTLTSATFTGQDGHTYSFYSIATDNVGNVQPTPSMAQATTLVDATPPTSSIAALPTYSSATFSLSWSGSDNVGGSGLATYSVFVSDNGSAFQPLETNTTLTSTTFTGQNGHTYGFYSIATDNAGNVQSTPSTAQATTLVDSVAPTSSVAALPTYTFSAFTLSWSGTDDTGGSGIASYDVFVSDDDGPYSAFLTNTTQTSATFTGVTGHTYTFYTLATDNVGNAQTTPVNPQTITVAPAADHLTISTPSQTIAGGTFSVTVDATDSLGLTDRNYQGSITLGLLNNPGSATLSGTTTVAVQNGIATLTGMSLNKTGSGYTLYAASSSDLDAAASSAITVAPTTHFSVSVVPANASTTAGGTVTVTVTALTASNKPDSSYQGILHFTSTDPQAILPSDAVFDGTNGTETFHVVLKTAGSQTISVSDSTLSTAKGTSPSIKVSALTVVSGLDVTGFPSTSISGTAHTFKVTAVDQYGNKVTGYNGTVSFASGTNPAVLPLTYTFKPSTDQGTHTFSATFTTTGTYALTATDTANDLSGSESNITVLSAATQLSLSGEPTSLTAGQTFSLTVTALVATSKTDTQFADTIHFTSTDPKAVLPPDYTFVPGDDGKHTFTLGSALETAGSQTITVSDITRTTIKAGSETSKVSAQTTVSTLLVSGFPTPTLVGANHTFKVTAVDQFGNLVPGYQGTVSFSGANLSGLPQTYTFKPSTDQGTHTFTASFTSATTNASITVTDTANNLSGSESNITVVSAATQPNPAATQLSLSGAPASLTAGQTFSLTVTALVVPSKTDTQFTDTIHFSSTDPRAVLPPDYTFVAADDGKHTFTLNTLETAGSQTITVSDISGTTIKATSETSKVSAGTTVSALLVSGFPSPTLVGAKDTFKVTAADQYGNAVPGYKGTITFSGANLSGLPQTYTFNPTTDKGTHTFTASFTAAGTNASLTVSATAAGITPGTESGINVTTLSALATGPTLVSGASGGVRGQPLTFTLNANESGQPTNAVYTFKIDWDGNGTVDQTVSGPSGTMVTHVYPSSGTDTVKVTVVDSAGNVSPSPATLPLQIAAVALEPDPSDSNETALVVGGTTGNDVITISPAKGNLTGGTLTVTINNVLQPGGPFTPTGHILVYGQGGTDTIREMATTSDGQTVKISVPALIFAGSGNNTLSAAGSSSNNVLVGGAGNDNLTGGSGQDILIGGSGADTLHAGSGDDILIGGTTAYNSNLTALLAILGEWCRTDVDYFSRVEDLFGNGSGGLNGSYLLNASTITKEAVQNQLFGGAGSDWFWINLGSPLNDKVNNLVTGEVANVR